MDDIDWKAKAQAAEQALSDLKREALEKVEPLFREARTELFALCEATEDECIAGIKRLVDGDEIPAEFVHEVGFYRGRKSEAKAISRAMGEVFRELLSTLHDKLGSDVFPESPSGDVSTHAAGEADVLDWLTERTNLSLEYDWPDEGEPGEWQVHRVSGNVNDREWELVGAGATPLDALRDALHRVKRVLTVPAAEYVPAIRDAWDIIDVALNPEPEDRI